MKYPTSLSVLALLVSLLAGCSKHSSDATAPNSAGTNLGDMGIVEVSDGVPIQRSLGGNRGCVITPTVFKDGSVSLTIAVMETNSAGVVQTLATPRVHNMADQWVEVRVNDIYIHLTPKIKQ